MYCVTILIHNLISGTSANYKSCLTVAEVILNDDLTEALQTCKVEQDGLAAKITTSRARQRYLEHLARTQEEGLDEDDEACVLCRCEFDRGYITPWSGPTLSFRKWLH